MYYVFSQGSRQISAGSTRAEAKSDNVSKAARDLLSREEEYKYCTQNYIFVM